MKMGKYSFTMDAPVLSVIGIFCVLISIAYGIHAYLNPEQLTSGNFAVIFGWMGCMYLAFVWKKCVWKE